MAWGGRWEGGSGLGTHVHPWQIHVDVWQNQYSIGKENKVKKKKKNNKKKGTLNLQNKNTLTERKQAYGYQRGMSGREG